MANLKRVCTFQYNIKMNINEMWSKGVECGQLAPNSEHGNKAFVFQKRLGVFLD
jgi:hypothetical protein